MWFMKKKVLYIVVFIGILIFLRIFFFEVYAINQSSMKNTYSSGDRVLIIKIFYTVRRNDIFVLKYENDNIIKRCLCLPGDTLIIKNGIYYSNGIALLSPKHAITGENSNIDIFTSSNIYSTYGTNWTLNNFGPYVVPKKGMVVNLTPNIIALYGQIIKGDRLSKNIRGTFKENSSSFYTFQNDYLFD